MCAGSALAGSTAISNATTAGGECSKVGQSQKTKGVTFVCKKTGAKLVWAKSEAGKIASTSAVTTAPSTSS